MAESKKSNAALYWVIGVLTVSMGVFAALFVSDAPKTLPKIKLSYFVDEQEIVDSVGKRLFQELGAARSFWVGVDPAQAEQIQIAVKLKSLFEKSSPLDAVIVDAELGWSEEIMKSFAATDVIYVKENWSQLGEKLQKLTADGKSYLVLTASIYSTSLLMQNPLNKMKQQFQIKPTTFSLAYFAATPEEEAQLLFKCDTEDYAGTNDWGCFAVNKARLVRRKYKPEKEKPWVGLMDLTGETDYAILLKKKF